MRILYNQLVMILEPTAMRAFLLTCLIGIAILAALYLRRRRVSPQAYLAWGLIIILFPLVGPFITILARPGSSTAQNQ